MQFSSIMCNIAYNNIAHPPACYIIFMIFNYFWCINM